MAHRTPQSFLKRQRERKRAEKAQKKEEQRRAKSAARRQGPDDASDESGAVPLDTTDVITHLPGATTEEKPGPATEGFRDASRDV